MSLQSGVSTNLLWPTVTFRRWVFKYPKMTIIHIIYLGLLEQRISELLGGQTGSQLCPSSAGSADGGVALLPFPPDPLDLRQEAGLGGQQPPGDAAEALP